MLMIGDVLVEEAVATERFRCDLRKCRGACCTLEGARGAPLLDEETTLIEQVLPAVRKYLPPRNLAVIERSGAVEGFPGSYATTCVEERDCVFVRYDGPVAKCSIEHAFNKGEIAWRKPVSCHLFPLRYSGSAPGILRYERIPECSAGREKGEAGGTPLREFVKDALVRRFGGKWTATLEGRCAAPQADAPAAPDDPRAGGTPGCDPASTCGAEGAPGRGR